MLSNDTTFSIQFNSMILYSLKKAHVHNDIAQWQIIIMYISYGKVFGGTPNICMFWLFPENGSILERTVNRALIVHTTLYNSALKKIFIFIFAMYQNYPLALIL